MGLVDKDGKATMSKIDTQGMSGPVDPNYKGPVGYNHTNL